MTGIHFAEIKYLLDILGIISFIFTCILYRQSTREFRLRHTPFLSLEVGNLKNSSSKITLVNDSEFVPVKNIYIKFMNGGLARIEERVESMIGPKMNFDIKDISTAKISGSNFLYTYLNFFGNKITCSGKIVFTEDGNADFQEHNWKISSFSTKFLRDLF